MVVLSGRKIRDTWTCLLYRSDTSHKYMDNVLQEHMCSQD